MLFKIVARWFVFLWIFLKFGLRWIVQPRRRPELTRRAFEDLGPTYIKLGQIVASSPGLFPERYCVEFQKCLDQVPPFGFDEVRNILGRELERPVEEVFAEIDPTPLAAASIAQVHAATLQDGTQVVVKVQRPRIERRVDADLWFMRLGARIGERLSYDLRLANLTGIIDDFAQTIHEELDFRIEARSMDEFNGIMARHKMADRVVAPRVYWDLTSERVLTMERFFGFKADDVTHAREVGLDTEKWLRIGMRSWNLTMMLHGFFHGDVHAGNLMFLPDRGQIGFIDFGIVGRFDPKQRMLVMRYVLSFSTQDYTELARVMKEMGATADDVDVDQLAADMKDVYSPLLERSISEIDYGAMLPDIIRNSRKHGVRLPREFVLILKQLLYFDRYAKLAAPDLNVFNDPFLVDFLFTPAAAACGIDMKQIAELLMAVQRATIARQQSATPAASGGTTAPA